MLANSMVVATNWRIQAHKQKDYNAEKNDKLGVVTREVKCVVFKLYQRSYAELRFIGSFSLLTALGLLTSFGPLSPISPLNLNGSFRLDVLGTLLGRCILLRHRGFLRCGMFCYHGVF